MTDKEFYIQNPPPDLPLFHKPFWLDSVCPGEWDVAILKKDNKIVASMPYPIKTIKGKVTINMPGLTHYMGPHIISKQNKNSTRVKFEVEALTSLLEQIPRFSYFRQTWYYPYHNWLPFYWNGYNQSCRYTYIIPKGISTDMAWQDFKGSVRTDLKKAEKENLSVFETKDPTLFHTLLTKSYTKQGLETPSFELYERAINSVSKHNSGTIFAIKDAKENIHAAIFLGWDDNSVYYIAGGHDSTFANSSAVTLLLWHGIKLALESNKNFDFAGSIVKNIEFFFRNFGGEQKILFQISKKNLTRADYLKESIRNLKKYITYNGKTTEENNIFS